MNVVEIQKKLKKELRPRRYEHTLNVVDSALKLAEIYPCDPNKVKLAALLHDCAKNYSDAKLLETAERHYLNVDEITRREPQLLHGPVGAVVARTEYGIENKEILGAIKYHTTGRKNMSVLEKIIYLADFIEPGRSYPGVDKLRKMAFENLDDAMIQALTNTIRYISGIGGLIHERTVSARNYLILEKMDREKNEKE